MKTRHNNISIHLTGFARRALLLFALVVAGVGSAWGQVSFVSSGVLDESHVGEYATMKSSYPVDASSLVPGVTTWSGSMGSETANHWSGNNVAYANTSSFTNSEVYKETTLNLPKGDYVILAAGRGSSSGDVTIFMSVGGHEVIMASRGINGKGVNTSGEASFDTNDTFSKNNNGDGWQYFYVKFSVTANSAVAVRVGGRTTANDKWVSISTPILWKTVDNNVTNLTSDMFHQWSGSDAGATDNGATICAYVFGEASETPYGDGVVVSTKYADLSAYRTLTLEVTEKTPRLFFNSVDDNNRITIDSSSPYVAIIGNKWIVDIERIVAEKGYAHLNAIKGPAYGQTVTIASAKLSKSSIKSLYHEWSSGAAGSTITVENPTGLVWKAGEEVAAGGVIYGNGSGAVPVNAYADLSQYDNLVLTYDNTKALPRFLFNMAEGNAFVEVNSEGDYMTLDGNKIIIHLAKLASDNGGYAHLNSIKAPWGGSSTIYNATLENVEKPVTIEKTIAVGSDNMIKLDGNLLCDHIPYNYIRIELTHAGGLTPASDGQDMTQDVSAATFRVESPYGDRQRWYTSPNSDGVYSYAMLGSGAIDGQIVSFSDFTFKLPNRYNYVGNHLKIYLSRFSDATYGENNPPEIEKIYDYKLWIAGNEADAQEHTVYANNEHVSSFTVDLDSLQGKTLNESFNILSDFGKNNFSEFTDFYLRWYVADKVTHQPITDANGNPISVNTPVLTRATNYSVQSYNEDVGMLWYLNRNYMGSPGTVLSEHTQDILSVRVNLPNGLTQDDVELVALVTDDYKDSSPGAEPSNLKHKYIVQFTNIEEQQYMDLPFRHYKGVTGRDWVKPEGSTGEMTQSIWKASTSYNKWLPTVEEVGANHNSPLDGSAKDTVADIRQGVHTWEYNVYITPSDGRRALVLPFENYMYGYQTGIAGDGNDLEPRAYFRWYDWKTDRAVANPDFTMTACNPNILKPYTETVDNETRDRGLVALNLDPDHPTQGRIGVWFEVGENFTEANYPNGLDIACDVSKYSDGIRVFGTNAYLEHEPTLSMRYIFHIHPASVIADTLKAAEENLGKARQLLENTSLTPAERLALYTNLEYYGIHHDDLDIEPMFNFPENRGRMVVSLGTGKKGNFSLRLDERSLDNYKLWDVNNQGQLVNADHVKWVAFYENEETGQVMRKELATPNTSFIQTFTYNDFKGNYYPLGWKTGDDMITVNDGMRFHVVGYVTSGDVNTLEGTGTFAPVAHYELQFLVAPPIPVISLRDNVNNLRADNITRTDEYLKQNYDLKTVVDFDGNPETNSNIKKEPERKHYFYSSLDDNPQLEWTRINDSKEWSAWPTTRANNMSWMPRQWGDIEYSYCYPQLCPYVINTNPNNSYWQYNHFLSPNHGDYMILKTMNLTGISTQRTEPYLLQFWDGTELHDYTYVYNHNGSKGSGSFLYTDASNESRTMITIPFEADLCGGSSIYFTAAVADMTDAQIKPQLLVRVVGIGENGERVRVVSFHTCEIFTAADDPHSGQWYQVYGESTIPANFDDGIVDFVCEVVNYADNTNGADFAIDHFQLYTNTAKVKLSQEQGKCDDPASNKMFIYADAEGIQALYGKTGTTKIYWRIHDEHGEVVTGPNMYDDNDPDGTHIYGEIEIPLDYTAHLTNNNASVNETMVKANDNLYWFMGDDHKVYCKIAYRYMPGLQDGQTYYVSVYDPARQRSDVGFRPENNSYWGGLNTAARSKCSVFSPFFIPRQQFVIYYTEGAGGGEGGHIMMSCNEAPVVTDMKMMLKKPELSEATGFLNITDKIHFDYFFGTLQQLNSNTETFTYNNTDYKFADLKEAWLKFRVSDDFETVIVDPLGTVTGSVTEVPTAFDETLTSGQYARTVLQAGVDAGLITLDYSFTFSNNFNTRPSKDFTVVCLPIEQKIPDTNPLVDICSPFVVKFDIVWPSPDMELGFADVEYPQREGYHRTIRIGLEQLYNLRKNGYKLHVPIHDFKDKTKMGNTGTIYFEDALLKVSAVSKEDSNTPKTNDPIGPAVGTNFARLLSPETGWNENGENPFVDADHMFLVLDLSGDNCAINFHEGYSYEVNTRIWDKADDQATPCYSDIFLTIKVVPEYVTWDPQELGTQTAGGVDYYNVNWNNDENWNRSERAEMYMETTNTPSAWRLSATTDNLDKTPYYGNYYYKNDTEIDANLDRENAFVPMKFTYVTMPEGCHAPSLINMNIQAYNNSQYNGGALLAGNLVTDPSPYDPDRTVNSPATADIVYDILVRYSEETCQGHLRSDKTTVYKLGKGSTYTDVYDCEKFYGNICKEIYFKPRAELINQQRLTYERAWVEKELMPNQWYLMSAPLKATYAGDMYVPKTDGRQTTEAFQPITFNTTSYSRTKYPFYQRSWDHGTGTNGSIVYTETNDPRQPYYDADMKFASAVTSKFAQWGHAFNDVQVRYDQMQGFAIRTKQKGSSTEKALLRLPKADTAWDYYNYKDVQGALHQGGTKGALNYGRFLTDDNEGKPINNQASMTIALVQPNENTDNQYFLVGNPYMASLDMATFFAANTHLGTKWWTIDGDPAAGVTTGRVRPMEAFFVKTTSPSTPVTFNKDMMVDGNDGTDAVLPSRQFIQLKASADGTTSTASVALSDSASVDYVENEDVETLFDSNLVEVPMVYTVASGQAVSINQLPQFKTVPFGVTCNSNEPVDVECSLQNAPCSMLYVYDAQTGMTTAVSDGESVSVQPNDYGRYYLTTDGEIITKVSNVASGVVISVRNGDVTVKSEGPIRQLRAVNISGATVFEQSDCGCTTTFRLSQGSYVIETEGAAGKQSTKVLVK